MMNPAQSRCYSFAGHLAFRFIAEHQVIERCPHQCRVPEGNIFFRPDDGTASHGRGSQGWPFRMEGTTRISEELFNTVQDVLQGRRVGLRPIYRVGTRFKQLSFLRVWCSLLIAYFLNRVTTR
jgi:hypothetical protein